MHKIENRVENWIEDRGCLQNLAYQPLFLVRLAPPVRQGVPMGTANQFDDVTQL